MELIAFLIGCALYFIPAIVAARRAHKSATAIVLLNFFLGWTLIGWIVAFVWSFTEVTQVVNNQLPQSSADEIQKLAGLRDKGLLTADEFDRKKQQLLNSV